MATFKGVKLFSPEIRGGNGMPKIPCLGTNFG